MTRPRPSEKDLRATLLICRQGVIHFPVSATAATVIGTVVSDTADERHLIDALRNKVYL